jgi:hypothetical protein
MFYSQLRQTITLEFQQHQLDLRHPLHLGGEQHEHPSAALPGWRGSTRSPLRKSDSGSLVHALSRSLHLNMSALVRHRLGHVPDIEGGVLFVFPLCP